MFPDPDFLKSIAAVSSLHARGTAWYEESETLMKSQVERVHHEFSSEPICVGEIGEFFFPFFSMGQIDSRALFGLDEIILFSFYYTNRNKYRKVLDLGANIGLHTLIMKKLGFDVVSYEPDETHAHQMIQTLMLNELTTEGIRQKAVSDSSGELNFQRVLNNTTGSHLLGSKDSVYGPTDVVTVQSDDISQVLSVESFDLIKMDVEGHEAILLAKLSKELIEKTDIMLEIGSTINAERIFIILKEKGIPAYSQKINWKQVTIVDDLPSHHSHGSVFLSLQAPPNWN